MSVIVPLYNVAEYVEETLFSLQRQALPGVEFILVDDGSTDDTFELASRKAAEEPRIRLVRQDNQGPSAARNHGLRLARGAYVCFVDGDDVLAPDALAIMHRAAEEHAADLVTGNTIRFDQGGAWDMKLHHDFGVAKPGPKTLKTHPELMYAVGPCAKLFRRELVDGSFFPEDIRLGEDQPFVLNAYARATKIYTVDAVVYHYRRREAGEESLTQRALSSPVERLDDLYAMVERVRPILTSRREFDYYLRRVMSADIWPRVRAAILSRQPQAQAEALASLRIWLTGLDNKTFNRVPALYYRPLAGLLFRFPSISPPARSAHRQTVGAILKKMTPRSYAYFIGATAMKFGRKSARATGDGLRGAASGLRRLPVRRFVFALAKSLPAQKKVVFAADQVGDVSTNLRLLRDAALAYDGWRVVTLLTDRRAAQSLRRYYELGRAAVVFVDDYYGPLRGLRGRSGGEVVQVWHAAGAFKKFGLSAIGAKDANTESDELTAHRSYTSVIASSTEVCPLYAQAFGVPTDAVLPLGVPRTDVFFDQAHRAAVRKAVVDEHPVLAGKKILLYAPTFRGQPHERAQFRSELDLDAMFASLGDEYALVVKAHPVVKDGCRIPEHLSGFALNLSHREVNDLMIASDLLITDYSSVVFEYSLLSRPMVFFAYDLDSYLDERGFYYDYRSFVPGPIVTTTSQVIDAIKQDSFDLDRIERFAARFFEHRDGRATQRVLEHFLGG